MILLIILGIIILLMAFLLLTPLYLLISTPDSRYEAGLRGIIKIWIDTNTDGLPEMQVKVFFIQKKIHLRLAKEKSEKPSVSKRIKKIFRRRVVVSRKKIKTYLKLFLKIFRSFKLKKLKLNIDTGDVIHNAHLIPVFTMIYKNNIQLSVNYEDKNEFILHFENNLGTILLHIVRAFIKHKLKK